MTVAELAAEAGVHQRYLREWLSHQATSNYLSYDPATQKFTLPEEQAMVFAVEDSPVYMTGAFEAMAALLGNQEKVQPAFKTGAGVGWGDQSACLFCATARFFRPGYQNNLVSNWLPALDGVVAKLERGAKIADVGCGHGWSTVFMAKAFPNSQFVGFDFHPSSVEEARAHARGHAVTANTRFEVGTAKDYPERDFDLVTFFLRLLARHGRPGRGGRARPAVAEAGWFVDGRRTDGRRPPRRQFEPGRPALLRRLDDGLRPNLVGARGRGRARCTGRRGKAARGHHRGRIRPSPTRHRNAVQHDFGGATVKSEVDLPEAAVPVTRQNVD